ncbi:hypothetical protein Ancab_017386 [Ancistrocladus abbreviatus]
MLALTAARRIPSIAISDAINLARRWQLGRQTLFFRVHTPLSSVKWSSLTCFHFPQRAALSFCSSFRIFSTEPPDQNPERSSKQGLLKPGLYLVGTPIGNLEDITLRALRVLRSANVILSEDTRHSRKLLEYYGIKTPLAALCAVENIPVVPIPGPSALVAALSASGLPTDEFTFVGFLPKRAGSRREKLMAIAEQTGTQILFVPPHKLLQFLEETSSIFGGSRRCVIAREMTKIHEEFWRGTLGQAKQVFSAFQPRGEITLLIEGHAHSTTETSTESHVEEELRGLITSGHSLSMAVKLVAEATSMKRKEIYSLALKRFGKQLDEDD